MDQELSLAYKKRIARKRYITIAAIFLLVIAGVFLFRSVLKGSVRRETLIMAEASLGAIEETIAATGIVQPEYEVVITTPIQARIVNVFHSAGTPIKKGASILQLDKEFSQLAYEKLQDEQEMKKNKITQLRWTLDKSLLDLQTQYSIKELRVKSLEATLKSEQQLFDIGGGTQENINTALLNLNVARKELEQLKKQISNQNESNKADLKELNFEIDIHRKEINEMKSKMEQAEIISNRDGVVTWVKDEIGSVINPGDELARIADLTSFKVEASISDTYADRLVAGGSVIVKINREEIRGKISNVKPTVENGIVKFTVVLDNKAHKLLRPSLKVDVYVVQSYKDKVVRVKNGPVFNEKGEQEIFVVNGDRAEKRMVRLGISNFDYIEIAEGVKPGEMVIISDYAEFAHLNAFTIKGQ
jgi:HlyD family secretion protein